MSSPESATPARPRGNWPATVVRKSIFPLTWVLGGLGLLTAGLLFVAVLIVHASTNTTGASWQPAALLGCVALAFAVPILIAGLLVRFGVDRPGPAAMDEHE